MVQKCKILFSCSVWQASHRVVQSCTGIEIRFHLRPSPQIFFSNHYMLIQMYIHECVSLTITECRSCVVYFTLSRIYINWIQKTLLASFLPPRHCSKMRIHFCVYFHPHESFSTAASILMGLLRHRHPSRGPLSSPYLCSSLTAV